MPDIGKESLASAGKGFFEDTADVVVDTALLTENDWHKYRKMGIGGSDAGAIFNVSPWTSAYGLWLTKTGHPVKEEKIDVGKEFIFEYGHAMEPLVASIFKKITGFEVMIDTYMYRHKKYPFMQANIDRVVILPNGKKALLECKTTTFFNKEAWENDNVPRYYKLQCQHYMAILDVDVCYIACVYGNTINDFVCRRIDRNLDEEAELIAAEKDFWENYVMEGVQPEFSTNGDIEKEAVLKTLPFGNKTKSVEIPKEYAENIKRYVELHTQRKHLESLVSDLNNEMGLLALPIMDYMGDAGKGYYNEDGAFYNITFSSRGRTDIDSKKLKLVYPEVYDEVCVKKEESCRPFSIKKR